MAALLLSTLLHYTQASQTTNFSLNLLLHSLHSVSLLQKSLLPSPHLLYIFFKNQLKFDLLKRSLKN